MRCNKNGRILEMISGGMPYQLWSSDEYKCPSCGVLILVKFGREPIAEHFDEQRYRRHKEYEAQTNNVVSIEV